MSNIKIDPAVLAAEIDKAVPKVYTYSFIPCELGVHNIATWLAGRTSGQAIDALSIAFDYASAPCDPPRPTRFLRLGISNHEHRKIVNENNLSHGRGVLVFLADRVETSQQISDRIEDEMIQKVRRAGLAEKSKARAIANLEKKLAALRSLRATAVARSLES